MPCPKCKGEGLECTLCPADHPPEWCPHQLRDFRICRVCLGSGDDPFPELRTLQEANHVLSLRD